ncbi:hypothetical protein GGI42DRAFT_147876 [Trichoderma sp. SZMC 28013]
MNKHNETSIPRQMITKVSTALTRYFRSFMEVLVVHALEQASSAGSMEGHIQPLSQNTEQCRWDLIRGSFSYLSSACAFSLSHICCIPRRFLPQLFSFPCHHIYILSPYPSLAVFMKLGFAILLLLGISVFFSATNNNPEDITNIMVDITNLMIDTSQSGRRAGRQRREHQAEGANTSGTNASDTASDTDATTNTNTMEGNPIPTIDSATVDALAAWEEWLLELIQMFYEYLVPLELNHDVEGRHRLINWLAENLGHDDALAQANPWTVQPEDRTAAHQNAAVTRVANRLSRAIQRLDRLEERIPEDDEHWTRMVDMTRGGADPYGPPQYGPPQHRPLPYNPHPCTNHPYNPHAYNPHPYGPHQYGPLPYNSPPYGIPQHGVQLPDNHSHGIHSFHPTATRQRRIPQPGLLPLIIPPPNLIPIEAPRRIPIYEVDLTTNELREIQSYDGRDPARDGTNMGATNGRDTNRRAANGVTTNGVATIRVTTNGLNTNRVATNGVATNGVTTNGMTTNGVTTNGVTTIRLTTNGRATNRVTTNGVTTNGMTTNGVATDEDDEIDL